MNFDQSRKHGTIISLRSKCDMDFYFGRFITVLKTWRTLIAAGNLYGVKQKPLCGLSENVTLHCL